MRFSRNSSVIKRVIFFSPPDKEGKFRGLEKKASILLVVFLYSLASSISGLYLPLFYLSRGIPIWEIILLLVATFSVIATVPIFFTGKNTIAPSLLFFSLFFLFSGFANPLLVGILYGLGLALFWPAVNSISARITSSDERAGFLSKISATRTAVPIAGVLFGGIFSHLFGLPSLIYLSAFFFALSFALSFFFLADLPSEEPSASKINLSFSDRNFFLFSAWHFLSGFADSTWLVYPLLIARLSQGNTADMGIASSGIAILSALVFLAVGKLSDSRGTRKPFLLLGIPFEFIWFFGVSKASKMSDIIILSISSSLASAFFRTADAMHSDCYEKRHQPLLMVLRETFLNLGRAASILLLSGLIISGNYSMYYRIFSAVVLLYIPIYFFLKERHNYG